MKALVVIPARGGSKGIPGKNLAMVAGRSLLGRAIDSARDSKSVDRIVVSTDSPQIREEAVRLGAEAPFLRPASLAADDTPGLPPILHAVDWLEEHQRYFADVVVCLQPTSPLRTGEDVQAALALLGSGTDAVVSVTPARDHPLWLRRIDEAGVLRPYLQAPTPARRQDLPPVYALNGAIFAARPAVLRATGGWYTDRTRAYVMPNERSIDIDTPFDLQVAELLLRYQP